MNEMMQKLSGSGNKPLNQPALLEDYLSNVNREIDKVKEQIYEVVNKSYNDFSTSFTHAMSLESELNKITSELELLSNRIEDPENGLRARMSNPEKEIRDLTGAVAFNEKVVEVLTILAQIHTLLQQFDDLVELGDLQKAASSLQDISSLLKQLPTAKDFGVDLKIVKIIKAEFTKKKSSLKHTLEDLFGRAISIDTKSGQPRATLKVMKKLSGTEMPKHLSTSVPLVQILEALDVMGLLLSKMEWLSKNLSDHFIRPLLTNPHLAVSSSDTGIISELVCAPAPGKREETASPPSITSNITSGAVFEKLLSVLSFVDAKILQATSGEKLDAEESGTYFAHLLGNAWWKELSKLIIDEGLERSLPTDFTQLERYSAFSELVIKFENELMRIGLVTSSGNRELKKYVDDVAIHYANKKRRDVLVIAREVLMRDDHNTVEVTNATERGGLNLETEDKGSVKTHSSGKPGKEGLEMDDGLISLPTCHISTRTQTLMELVYQTLNEASPSQPHLASQLYFAARDILDLFRAIVPIYHQNSIEEIPGLSMLFFNDCMYISYHLHTLGFQYQAKLPAPLNKTATFVDLIPLFRKLGDKYYRMQVEKRTRSLLELVQEAGGLTGTHDDERFSSVERIIRQLVLGLSQLSKAWKPILPVNVYLVTLGELCESVITQLIRELQRLPDISEVETHQLHHLFTLVLSQVPSLFAATNPTTKEKHQYQVATYVASWVKFEKLTELLEARLADITQRYDRGALAEFSPEELRSLVKALFADTEKRSELLSKFSQH